METGRWIGPWHGVCLLRPLPLLLLSKLVSKLDVLPGQFEVALLPPSSPANTQAARCQCRPGGLRQDRITGPPLRTGESRKTPLPPPPPPSQAKALAITLWPVSICHRTPGTPEKSVLQVGLLPISDLHLHQGKAPSCHLVPDMPYLLCSQAALVSPGTFSKLSEAIEDIPLCGPQPLIGRKQVTQGPFSHLFPEAS